MQPENNQATSTPTPTPQPTKGYGKRPLWQWIVLYAIVGAIAYGLIYFFFIRGGSGY